MKKEHLDKIKSALRHFVLTAAAVWVVNPDADVKAIIAGAIAGIAGPAIRAIDKNDPAFGRVADWVEVQIKDLAKKPAKKTAKKKA